MHVVQQETGTKYAGWITFGVIAVAAIIGGVCAFKCAQKSNQDSDEEDDDDDSDD